MYHLNPYEYIVYLFFYQQKFFVKKSFLKTGTKNGITKCPININNAQVMWYQYLIRT